VLVAWKYRPRDTFIQRLDPRARLIYLACIILAISGTDVWDIRYVLPLFALTMILYFMARIEWRDVRRAWAFILLLVLFIVGINGLLSGRGGPTEVLRDQSAILLQSPTLHIPATPWSITIRVTVVRAFFALVQITRMLTMAALAIPIPYTMDPSIYGVTFRRMGLPDKFSFTMDLAFRFIPTLGRDFMITVDAQRARGYEVESAKGGVINRLRRLAPLIVPVTMSAIVTGEEVIDAMDLRAFGVRPRTWYRQLHFELRDYLFVGLGVAILATFITIRILGYGDFWVPEWWLRLASGS
jgi:energy-coupling factor transport system permease protein